MPTLLTGCGSNFTPLYAEMTPEQVESVVAERIHVGDRRREVTDELDDMRVDYNFRPGEPEPVIVVFVRPREFFYAGPDWERLEARGLLTIHFADRRVTGADYTRYEAGDEAGITKELALGERGDGVEAEAGE